MADLSDAVEVSALDPEDARIVTPARETTVGAPVAFTGPEAARVRWLA